MRRIGSQFRETLAEAGYHIAGRDGEEVILADGAGKLEVWVAKNDYAGYVIDIDGIGHEFCRSL